MATVFHQAVPRELTDEPMTIHSRRETSVAEALVTEPSPNEQASQLAAESLADGDPTGWFERLYEAAEKTKIPVPWDRNEPHRLLVQWVREQEIKGAGKSALVVGCGLGHDAEYVAQQGFNTVAFDIAATAIHVVHQRFPDSDVQYLTADLLAPPAQWRESFDLVVESLTVQALPDPPRRAAIARVAQMVKPGGTLVVIAAGRADDAPDEGPPWPLTRAEIESFATGGVRPVAVEDIHEAGKAIFRWRAEFTRQESGL